MPGDKITWAGIEDFKLFGEKKPVLDCRTVDFKSALNFHKGESYIDASTPFWENTRVAIMESSKKSLWDEIFNKAQACAKKAYEASPDARKLAAKLGVEETVFLADLPCIGAAMERLEYSDWKDRFFNRALKIYNSGYWICGFADNKFIICGEYE